MGYSAAYMEKNRDVINAKRRATYCNAKRKARYLETRDELLARLRCDKQLCPICQISFNRQYIAKHTCRRAEKICVPLNAN